MSNVFGMKTANHQYQYNILSYWNEISEFTKGKSFYLHLIFLDITIFENAPKL